jgi:predicted nuclease of predicted toxin-antitoxin system
MNLFIDENASLLVVDCLRVDGHDLTLAQDAAFGRPDRELLTHALQLGAIILTNDTDLGELVMRERLPGLTAHCACGARPPLQEEASCSPLPPAPS